MIKQPPNENPSLENLYTMYLGVTGSGKSQALKQCSGIPETGARVVLFDPSKDHPKGTLYYSDRAEFARALDAANSSGRGFRIAYSGVRSVEIYEWWCRCVHAILDGNKITYTITEELGRVALGSGKTTPYHGWLLNEGRKYGVRYHATSQFPARISKDVYDNSGIIYFGMQPPRLRKLFAGDFGLDLGQLTNLGALEFLRWQLVGDTEFVKLAYRSS
jgi:energy-coupling factor transporter ATP-binding protein EcfA2